MSFDGEVGAVRAGQRSELDDLDRRFGVAHDVAALRGDGDDIRPDLARGRRDLGDHRLLLGRVGLAVAAGGQREGAERGQEGETQGGQGLHFILRFIVRSEEHTSELQSLMRISYAVFCLKKNKSSQTTTVARDY